MPTPGFSHRPPTSVSFSSSGHVQLKDVAFRYVPDKPLIDESGIALTDSYDDADGGKQVIEDGINTSLKQALDLESLESGTVISLDVDFEKLYFNMLDAKADWLYHLKEWDDVLSEEKRHEITKEFRASKVFVKQETVGRNDPCPCGSGKKYKKCCGKDK